MRARQTENWSQSNSYNNNNNNGKVVYCLLHGNNIFNRLLNCWSPFGSDCSRHRFLRTVSGKLQGKCKNPYPSPSPSFSSSLFSTQPVHDFHKIYAPRLENTNVKWWNFYLVQSEIFYIYSTIYIYCCYYCLLVYTLFLCKTNYVFGKWNWENKMQLQATICLYFPLSFSCEIVNHRFIFWGNLGNFSCSAD